MSTLDTFHLFSALPSEIRIKIWSLNLSICRTVTISCIRDVFIRGAPRAAKSWTSDTPPPPLLLVNRESRYEALAIYKPYFTAPSSIPIYLCFDQDTVKFADGIIPYIPKPTLLEIRKMVLHTKDCAYFGFYNMDVIKSMKMLKNLEIYAEEGVASWWNDDDRYLTVLMSNFEDAIDADPGWECPMVTVYEAHTGKKVRFLAGGAKIPGWVPEM